LLLVSEAPILGIRLLPLAGKEPWFYFDQFEGQNPNSVPSSPFAKATKGQLEASEATLKAQQVELAKNISDIERKAGFDTTKIKAKIAQLTLVQDQQKQKLHAKNILYTQEEESKKWEINHEEKFRQYYVSKLLQNAATWKASPPVQRPYFKKLVTFDKTEIKDYEDHEKDNNSEF
jgi:hypothetical protein